MKCPVFRIAISLAIVALPAAGAFGQESFPALTNLGFATTWPKEVRRTTFGFDSVAGVAGRGMTACSHSPQPACRWTF